MPSAWKIARANAVQSLALAGVMLMANQVNPEDDEDEDNLLAAEPLAATSFHGLDEGFEPFGDFDENEEMNIDELNVEFNTFDDIELEPFKPLDEDDEEVDEFPPFDDVPVFRSIQPVQEDFSNLNDLDDEMWALRDEMADALMGGVLMAIAAQIGALRGPYNQIFKSKDWFELSMTWPPVWFRGTYRMSLRTFRRITTLLEERPIFQSGGNRPQRPVAYQLACFLVRYGVHGATGFGPAAKLSLGVGTVYLYCKRVTRALREIGLECIAWPDEERKAEIKAAFEEISGIPGCIGAGDGTLVKLRSKPCEEGNEYFCYKGFVAVDLLCVVDHQKQFIAYEGGWAGCKSDQTTFRSSRVWECRGALIQRGERLLVDKGFFTSPYTCRPYNKEDVDTGTAEEQRAKRRFNARFSKARVVVENAFALLKQRFPAVDYMSTAVDIQTTHRVLEALLVLHNLCIDYEDETDDDGEDSDDELEQILHWFPGHIDIKEELPEGGWNGFERNQWLSREGNRLREELREISQAWADARD